MLSILLVIVVAAVVTTILLYIDRLFAAADQERPLPIGSSILLSVAIWTVFFVALCAWLELPGSAGPVQYAVGDDAAMFVFKFRGATILALMLCPIVSALVALCRGPSKSFRRRGWMALGIVSYVVAWIVVFANMWFFPMV